jgi:hypothetical protein
MGGDGSLERMVNSGQIRVVVRFELAVRHCPKCGWQGTSTTGTLRYCGPGQRAEPEWHELYSVPTDESEDVVCSLPGEHFHWCCHRCRYRRLLPVPDQGGASMS